jgi:hypothetical protein
MISRWLIEIKTTLAQLCIVHIGALCKFGRYKLW